MPHASLVAEWWNDYSWVAPATIFGKQTGIPYSRIARARPISKELGWRPVVNKQRERMQCLPEPSDLWTIWTQGWRCQAHPGKTRGYFSVVSLSRVGRQLQYSCTATAVSRRLLIIVTLKCLWPYGLSKITTPSTAGAKNCETPTEILNVPYPSLNL